MIMLCNQVFINSDYSYYQNPAALRTPHPPMYRQTLSQSQDTSSHNFNLQTEQNMMNNIKSETVAMRAKESNKGIFTQTNDSIFVRGSKFISFIFA